MGPTVTRPVEDPLAELFLDNRLYLKLKVRANRKTAVPHFDSFFRVFKISRDPKCIVTALISSGWLPASGTRLKTGLPDLAIDWKFGYFLRKSGAKIFLISWPFWIILKNVEKSLFLNISYNLYCSSRSSSWNRQGSLSIPNKLKLPSLRLGRALFINISYNL